MRVDCFHRTEKKYFDRNADADRTFIFYVPVDATIAQILEIGYSQRMPKGSARAGCYEVQTDKGIFTSHHGGRIVPEKAIFKTWEQLEAEEG